MPQEPEPCTYCGMPMPADGLWLEVIRDPPDLSGDPDYTNVSFCSQGHASAYFGERRLPPADHHPDRADSRIPPLTWKERLGFTAVAIAILSLSGLLSVGLITVVRWLLE